MPGSVRDEQYPMVPDTAIGISRGHWAPNPDRSGREMTRLGEKRIIWEARECAAGLFGRGRGRGSRALAGGVK